MGIIKTTPVTEPHPLFGSTPKEIIEAIQNGTYEAQPGLADHLAQRGVEAPAADTAQQKTSPGASTPPAAPAPGLSPAGVTTP